MSDLRKKAALIFEGAKPYQKVGRFIDVFLIILILLNVIAIVLESEASLRQRFGDVFFTIEVVSVAIFTIEYLLRLWSCVEKLEYLHEFDGNWKTRLHYMFTPLAIIDLIAILPTWLMMFFSFDLRFLRVVRLLRIFKLTRYSRAMQVLLESFKEEKSSLIAAFFIMAVIMVLAACGIYLLEHDVQPDKFGSIPSSMWWALVTLTTVGYGDVVPITAMGKLFGGVITLLSMGMVAIPTGLLASSFADQLRKRREAFQEAVLHSLVDGELSKDEREHLEQLRVELGLSHTEANKAIKLILSQRVHSIYCRHCGQKL
ncbi:Potassium voltage-gated channel subfamily KQT; possible potassium channel, VIC family [Pseudoalteromonas luteoviolacea B = ATCC 29581]|nr:Potassium voltage-gated channel subfamily KQT; possible potassium channel, VIC family [Pseudoalteromonas luteoviolacea B = ATCC 29581]